MDTDWLLIKTLIRKQCPNAQIIFFGSRSTQTADTFSDYDVAIKANEALSLLSLSNIKESLANSDLPVKVDVLDYWRLEKSFQKYLDWLGED